MGWRSLVAAALVLLWVAGWTLLRTPVAWTACVAMVLLLPTLLSSLRELAGKLRLSAGRARVAAPGSIFQARMAHALRGYSGRVLLILSGADFTAKEFVEYAGADPAWSGLLQLANLRRIDIPAADHTFSTAAWRAEVEEATLAWLVDAGGRR